MSLADVFPEPHYHIADRRFRDIRVVRLDGFYEDAPLLLHLSAGVPFGGGVLAALQALREGVDSGSYLDDALRTALRFGRQAARLYMSSRAGAALSPAGIQEFTPDWDVADVVTIVEVMALTHIQLSGILVAAAGEGISKSWMPVIARQSLYQFSQELSGRVQKFLASHADEIRESFAEDFGLRFPDVAADLARDYNPVHGRPPDAPVDLWRLRLDYEGPAGAALTLGQFFNEILAPASDGERIGPKDAFGVSPADSGGMDRSRGEGFLGLAVLEARAFGRYDFDKRPGRHGLVDHSLMEQSKNRLERAASDGEDAALVARGLSSSPEGQSVTDWLRQVVGATGRSRAGRRCRRFALGGPVVPDPVPRRTRARGAGHDAEGFRRAARRGPPGPRG